jgi:hypothetical protein
MCEVAMSLPARQQRKLQEIEGRLARSDPRLRSLFVTFSRLTLGEKMPWFEDVRVRPVVDRLKAIRSLPRQIIRRPAARARAFLLLPAILSAAVCALMIAAGFPGAQRPTPAAKATTARELVVKPSRLCRLSLIRVPVFC